MIAPEIKQKHSSILKHSSSAYEKQLKHFFLTKKANKQASHVRMATVETDGTKANT